MDATHLSKRLAAVAEYVPESTRMADIGSDHAYLPVWLAKQGKLTFGVAGEVVPGPLKNAETTIAEAHLENVIHPRLGDGLMVIQPDDDLDTIVIAGMGGTLISDILTRGWQKLTGKERLVLQPNVGEAHLRQWLVDHQYGIIAEQILDEDGHIYEIIVAEKQSAPVSLSHLDISFGPFLRRSKSAVFTEKWTHEEQRTKRVIDSLHHASVEPTAKEQEFDQRLKDIQEVLADESTDLN